MILLPTKNSALKTKSLYNTLKASPIGDTLGLGQGELDMKGKTVAGVTKGTWYEPNTIVILYTLYLFAEHMDPQQCSTSLERDS